MRYKLITYDKNSLDQFESESLSEILLKTNPEKRNWIDVMDFSQYSEELEKEFKLHRLLQEDILNHKHIPKFERHEDFIYLSINNLKPDLSDKENHKSFILGSNFLLSFHLTNRESYNSVADRLINATGKVRNKKVDFLLYRIIDLLIDNYFPVSEDLRVKAENLEELMFENYNENYIHQIMALRYENAALLRMILPLKDILMRIKSPNNELTDKANEIYFNDLLDHINLVVSTLDTVRELIHNLRDLHTTNLSTRMNQVMKTLTIVATIFIPLTFIVGVYGMNFRYMPELDWKYAYPIIWGIMIILVLIMLWIMKRQKWI